MKLFFAGGLGKRVAAALPSLPENVEIATVEEVNDLFDHLHEADALLLHDPGLDVAAKLRAGLEGPDSKVRWIQVLSAGYEGFATSPPPETVALSNQGGAVAPYVAQHAVALSLALLRQLPRALAQQSERRWEKSLGQSIQSLHGRTVAIIGYGHIGRHLAALLQPFGARIIAVGRSPAEDANVDQYLPLDALHGALAQADVAIVAIAFAPATHHLIDREALAAIKKGAVLVNVSRGGTVDPIALREALETGQLSGAGIDVTEPEPLPADDPLWSAPNLLITPHVAGGGGIGVAEHIASVVAENLKRRLDGRPLLHAVYV